MRKSSRSRLMWSKIGVKRGVSRGALVLQGGSCTTIKNGSREDKWEEPKRSREGGSCLLLVRVGRIVLNFGWSQGRERDFFDSPFRLNS